MSRNSLFLLALLLLFSLTNASRQVPAQFRDDSPLKSQQGGGDQMNNMELNEGCEGVGEEECLMRRTLVAHVDYIYTQSKKNP